MKHVNARVIRNPLVNWNFTTEPEKGTGDRRMEWPRGRTLGGSSSINGMLYVRGAPADFDGWAQMGCRGWSYDDVLTYFMKSEDYVQGGDPEVRGQGGREDIGREDIEGFDLELRRRLELDRVEEEMAWHRVLQLGLYEYLMRGALERCHQRSS